MDYSKHAVLLPFLVLIFSLVGCSEDAPQEGGDRAQAQQESAPAEASETQTNTVEGKAEVVPQASGERVIDVIASDFSIEAPETLDTGWYTMRLDNQGRQTHFVIMYRLVEGKTIGDQRREVVPAFDELMAGLRAGEIEKQDIPAFLGTSAALSLSETLYHELRLRQSPVGCSALCPEVIRTSIGRSDRRSRRTRVSTFMALAPSKGGRPVRAA